MFVLALTSPTSGSRSVGMVCLRTEATEFFLCVVNILNRALALLFLYYYHMNVLTVHT
jgi:hypothetical protein